MDVGNMQVDECCHGNQSTETAAVTLRLEIEFVAYRWQG